MADTTKSGQLLFPEFALAMYLCNLKLQGKTLPNALPEKVTNEVSSMVDIISFGVPDTKPPALTRTNVPNFSVTPAQSPQSSQAPSNASLLTTLQTQSTGMPNMPMMTQPTGFGNQGFMSQPTGFARPPMPPMPTGMSSVTSGQLGANQLTAQPTGMPGQWGYVNAPAGGLPGISLLESRMLPQAGRESGNFTTAGLQGNATIPWAVTKDEKTSYDNIFRAWDGLNQGYLTGQTCIEVFGQSGLDKKALEQIWTLADPHNRGKLDKDEFSVAMHLIYRKLNGYDVPARLPPELVPPSHRKFAESVNTVKGFLRSDADARKASGVSYLKSHSFKNDPNRQTVRKDATVYKHDDNDVGYKSSARHRAPTRDRSPAPEARTEELSIEQLRKKVREKQILLNAIDIKDEAAAEDDEILDRRDRRDAEDLLRRIRRIQDEIDTHPNAQDRSADADAERRQLRRQLQNLTDRLPDIASKVRKTERSIAEAKLELFRLRDAKAHPNSASSIVGTGPGGSITDADRLKARSKAMMQQRLAALTGKPAPPAEGEDEDAPRRLADETQKITTERENNERMTREVEESVEEFRRGLEDALKGSDSKSSANEHEFRRWEEGLGVEDEVRDFIFELQRSSRASRMKREDDRDHRRGGSRSRYEEPPKNVTSPPRSSVSTPTPVVSSGGSYSSYKTPEERAAFIKQQAEQRMAERLAAMGIKSTIRPGAFTETAEQRQERERREAEERRRKAEEEEAKREQLRQQRLAGESIAPPSVEPSKPLAKKPPPPPPSSRGAKKDTSAQDDAWRRAERRAEEQALAAEQEAQEKARSELEYVPLIRFPY